MDPFTASLIATAVASGGASIYDGMMDRRDADTTRRMNQDNYDRSDSLQREFAQNGISWKVQDAERAGIHPLFALGAQGASYSPSTFIAGDLPRRNTFSSLASMGQDVSRAVFATAPQRKRDAAMFELNREQGELENAILRHKLSQMRAVGPAMPLSGSGMSGGLLDGQGDSLRTSSGYVSEMPLVKTHSEPGRSGKQVGHIDDYTFSRTADGGYAVSMTPEWAQNNQDNVIGNIQWMMRNYLTPGSQDLRSPNTNYYRLPNGYRYVYSPIRGTYDAVPPFRKRLYDSPAGRSLRFLKNHFTKGKSWNGRSR